MVFFCLQKQNEKYIDCQTVFRYNNLRCKCTLYKKRSRDKAKYRI